MARISIDDARAWVESTKLSPVALDLDHLSQLEEEVLDRIASVYDISSWIDKATTPRLIQVIIAKTYAGWLYDKYYSENQNQPNKYSQLLKQNAETLIQSIISGTITIPGTDPTNSVGAVFYPNDASSAINPNTGYYDPALNSVLLANNGDTSVGPAKFSMGSVF